MTDAVEKVGGILPPSAPMLGQCNTALERLSHPQELAPSYIGKGGCRLVLGTACSPQFRCNSMPIVIEHLVSLPRTRYGDNA